MVFRRLSLSGQVIEQESSISMASILFVNTRLTVDSLTTNRKPRSQLLAFAFCVSLTSLAVQLCAQQEFTIATPDDDCSMHRDGCYTTLAIRKLLCNVCDINCKRSIDEFEID